MPEQLDHIRSFDQWQSAYALFGSAAETIIYRWSMDAAVPDGGYPPSDLLSEGEQVLLNGWHAHMKERFYRSAAGDSNNRSPAAEQKAYVLFKEHDYDFNSTINDVQQYYLEEQRRLGSLSPRVKHWRWVFHTLSASCCHTTWTW